MNSAFPGIVFRVKCSLSDPEKQNLFQFLKKNGLSGVQMGRSLKGHKIIIQPVGINFVSCKKSSFREVSLSVL